VVNNKHFNLILITALFVLLSSCNSNDVHEPITINIENTTTITPQITSFITATPISTIEPTSTIEPYTTIVLGSVGDIMCHKMQLIDAQNTIEMDNNFTRNGDEQYSFNHWFEYIKPSLEYADLMIGNLETTIAVDNSLVSGYPFFATPKEILPDLKEAGFDMLINGNNHMLDKKQAGLISTVSALNDANINYTGVWTSIESKNTPLIIDVKGIKVGIISATCSVNDQDRLLTEEENSYMYLSTNNLDEISMQIKNCKSAGADIIIMCPHWGSEGAVAPNSGIIDLAEEYIKLGVDIIFAHHPHVLQPVDRLQVTLENGEVKEGIVFYSLGNFISNQMKDFEKLTGAIGYVEITKDNASGKFTFSTISYLPTLTYISYNRETNTKSYTVLPAGHVLDNPEKFEAIDPIKLKVPLENAYYIATSRLGNNIAIPLRCVPES